VGGHLGAPDQAGGGLTADDYVEIVPMTRSRADADAAFRSWLEERDIAAADLKPEDVRIDILRGIDKHTYYRYSIARDIADKLR